MGTPRSYLLGFGLRGTTRFLEKSEKGQGFNACLRCIPFILNLCKYNFLQRKSFIYRQPLTSGWFYLN